LVKERITLEALNRQLKSELQEETQRLKDSIVQSTGQREKLALIEEKVCNPMAYSISKHLDKIELYCLMICAPFFPIACISFKS
jgi:hypothetical protein